MLPGVFYHKSVLAGCVDLMHVDVGMCRNVPEGRVKSLERVGRGALTSRVWMSECVGMCQQGRVSVTGMCWQVAVLRRPQGSKSSHPHPHSQTYFTMHLASEP
eukprot:1160888-Pelagomonas_calceolata.AAC.2